MRILNNAIFDWSSCRLESAVVANYDGPLWLCGGKGGSAPPPPDPYATASAQTGTNQATAGYNNAITHGNTTTPLGSQTYTPRVDPTTGATVYDQSIALDPQQQQLLDQQTQQNLALGNTAQGMLGEVSNAYKQPVDTSSLPGLMSAANINGQPPIQGSIDTSNVPGLQSSINTSGVPGIQSSLDFSKLPGLEGANDLQGARQQVQDALYKQQASYLDPQYQQGDTAMRTRLANQGITEGSEAWNNAIDAFNRDKQSNYQSARNSAIAGGGQELSNLANIALANRGQMANEASTAGNFANNANNQAFSQAAQQAAFGNQANQQGFGQAAQSGAFTNSAHAQAVADALSAAGLNNSARQQGLQENLALRNQPLNEFNALRSASPVSVPQFGTAGNAQTQPADLSGNIWNAYQGQLSNYNQGQAAGASNTATIGGVLGAAMLAF